MANMREIRTRINSVQDTMKITNAMYLISSSKLRKARSNRDAVEPHFEALQWTIADILDRTQEDLSGTLFDNSAVLEKEEKDRKRCFIVITSDKGLAGSYNHNVFKMTDEYIAKGSDNTICMIGFMAKHYFGNRQDVVIDDEFSYPAAEPTGYRAKEMADYVIKKFNERKFDEVYVMYTQMINSMVFEARELKLLPLSRNLFDRSGNESEVKKAPTVFSPSPIEVLTHILPNYVKGVIYGAMVESYACEQSARMTAMDSATTNAKEMIRELSLMYNRVRQAAITQEITEIVSGAQSQG